MAKQMTTKAAGRIQSATAKKGGVSKGSFVGRAQRAAVNNSRKGGK